MSDNNKMEKARAAHIRAVEYRNELAKARIQAVRLANKLIGMGLSEDGPINKDVIDAMREILRDARETIGQQKRKLKPSDGTGIPSDLMKKAMETLGEK